MTLWYRQGTASVDNGATTVTGALTGWDSQAKAGDAISFDDGAKWYEIASVEGNTTLTLATAFGETTVEDGDYAIQRSSPKWSLATDTAVKVAELLGRLTTLILTDGAPDDGIGTNGMIAFDPDAQLFYLKQDGEWDEGTSIVGDTGSTGDTGPQGDAGWSPLIQIASDGTRRVLEVFDWTGGEGTEPTSLGYVSDAGLTATIGDAIDIRGPEGAPGSMGGTLGTVDNRVPRADGDDETVLQPSEMEITDDGAVILPEVSTPDTPASGRMALYFKSDTKLYKKDDAGTEAAVGEVTAAMFDELVLTTSLLALQLADNTNVALFGGSAGNRVFDSFDALTYVDVAGASNLNSSVAGLLKPTQSASTSYSNTGGQGDRTGIITVSQTGITLGGTSTINNLVDGAKSGSDSDAIWANGSTGNPSITFDFGAGRVIDEIKWFEGAGSNSFGTWKVQGSNNASDWTDISSNTAIGAATTTTITISSPGLYRYYRLQHVSGSIGNSYRQEIEFKIASSLTTDNLTVVSDDFTAASAPSTMSAVLRVKEVDAATANTDYTIEFSRDGGSNWDTATITELFTSPSPTASIRVCRTDDVDVSGQPSGTAPMWRFKTANNKMIELHDLALYWA